MQSDDQAVLPDARASGAGVRPQTTAALTPLSPAGDSTRRPEPQIHGFAFTGSGKEYFRIWIVNLCLTIATLGFYSPWAKVRRLQYFARNTQLAGAVFDFHGEPKAILKGRIVALVLMAAYTIAFDFSLTAGMAVVGFLLLGFPLLMRSALRFRLANTSYRGLRFGFEGGVGGTYGSYGPVVLLFALPSVVLALAPQRTGLVFGGFALYLLWPILHAQIKRYQHNGLTYGASRAQCFISTGDFFAMYFFAGLIGFASVAMTGIVTALGYAAFASSVKTAWWFLLPTVAIAIYIYLACLLSIPYLQIRIYNAAWSATEFAGVSIRSALRAAPFVRLQIANTLLTLSTFGLYRPFAVVRTHRFRLANMTLVCSDSFDRLLAAQHVRKAAAQGDRLADFLNIDLSW